MECIYRLKSIVFLFTQEVIINMFTFYRNLWMSIVLALPSVIILYVLTNISYFTVMSKATLLSSNAAAVVCRTTENSISF